MELICLIKCLTELAFRVQREFKQERRDETGLLQWREEKKMADREHKNKVRDMKKRRKGRLTVNRSTLCA